MPVYPVRVPLLSYRGTQPRKVAEKANYDRVAAKVESYLNGELQRREDGVHVFLSHTVADQIREDYELVRRVVGRIDGGSSGVTIRKGDPIG